MAHLTQDEGVRGPAARHDKVVDEYADGPLGAYRTSALNNTLLGNIDRLVEIELQLCGGRARPR